MSEDIEKEIDLEMAALSRQLLTVLPAQTARTVITNLSGLLKTAHVHNEIMLMMKEQCEALEQLIERKEERLLALEALTRDLQDRLSELGEPITVSRTRRDEPYSPF